MKVSECKGNNTPTKTKTGKEKGRSPGPLDGGQVTERGEENSAVLLETKSGLDQRGRR